LSSVFCFFLSSAVNIFSVPCRPFMIADVLFVHIGVLFVHIR